MKKLIVIFLFLMISSICNSTIIEFKGTGTKFIDVINASVVTGSFVQWTFTGASAYNKIDFTETNETTASVSFLSPSGTVLKTDSLTSGTPITNQGYEIVEVRINNTQGSTVLFNGQIRLYSSDIDLSDIQQDIVITSGNLSVSGDVTIIGGGNLDPMLIFDTDRGWRFIQKGTGTGTALGLKTDNDAKQFIILDSFNNNRMVFNVTSLDSTSYIEYANHDFKPVTTTPSAKEGRTFYHNTNNKMYTYDGTTWKAHW